MKLSTLIALFRPLRFALLIGGLGIYGVLSGALLMQHTGDEITTLTIAVCIIAPLFLGRAFSLALHAVWHRPATATLPGAATLARRMFLGPSLLIAGLAALVNTWAAFPLHPAVAFSVAWAMSTVTLPFEKGLRYHGQLACSLLGLALLAGLALRPQFAVDLLAAHPVPATLAALALTGLNLRLPSRRVSLRRRAHQVITTGVDMYDADLRDLAWKSFWRRRKSAGRSWSREQHPATVRDWCRVHFYEHLGIEGGLARMIGRRMGLLLSVLLGIEFYQFTKRALAGEPYATRWDELQQTFWIGDGNPAGFVAFFAVLVSFFVLSMPLPTGNRMYPVSRYTLARTVIAMSLLQVAGLFLMLALGLAAMLGLSAALASQPTPTRMPLAIGFLVGALPLTTVLLWIRSVAFARGRSAKVLLGTVGLVGFIGSVLLSFVPDFALSGAGLATVAACTIAFGSLHIRTLWRHFTRGDLNTNGPNSTEALWPPALRGRA